MRETYTSLQQTARDLCVSAQSSSTAGLSDTLTFLRKQINTSSRFIHAYISNYETQDIEKTSTTVADQQFYHYPPGLNHIESIQVTVGGVDYTPEVVESESTWKWINSSDTDTSAWPRFIYPRRDDFGIWPTPNDAYTITFNGNYIPKDMIAEDYSSGTVVVAQNGVTVTGTDTTFTALMVGRWFRATDDGDWYRIAAFGSTTSLTLESTFEGSSVSGSAFTVGESPEIPMELHEYIPFRAAAAWYAGPRRNLKQSKMMNNYFYTGDFDNPNRKPELVQGGLIYYKAQLRELGRDNSQLVRKTKYLRGRFDESSTTLTS